MGLTFSESDSNDLQKCIQHYEEENAMDSSEMAPHILKHYIYLMIDESDKAPINSDTFTKQQLESIARELFGRTGAKYSEPFLRRKYRQLRYDWRLYHDLCEHGVGVGWDRKSGAIIASEQQWDQWKLKNPDYEKFKFKGLTHYFLLTKLFSDSIATGDYGRKENQAPGDSDEEREVEMEFRGRTPSTRFARVYSRKTRKRSFDSSGGSSDGRSYKKPRCTSIDNAIENALDNAVNAWEMRQMNLASSINDHVSTSIDNAIDDAIGNVLIAWAMRQKNLTDPMDDHVLTSIGIALGNAHALVAQAMREMNSASPMDDHVSVEACMDILDEMVISDELFLKATQCFRDPINRIIFEKSPPEKRLLILTSLP